MTSAYSDFFKRTTGFAPYPYQTRLGTEAFPTILDVPTGLGKTAAVAVAWLYKRIERPQETPRRLVYCLPMRVLVEQTQSAIEAWVERCAEEFRVSGQRPPAVDILMGGDQQLEWAKRPEAPAVVVGTQDMLISRALMRGYGMSRYEWPVHYGLLHNDALWIYDETQLMGASVPTSAQLHAFRESMGTIGPTDSIWMSATVDDEQFETVDHERPADGWTRTRLSESDRREPDVRQRLDAAKSLDFTETEVPNSTASRRLSSYAESLASEVAGRHDAHDGLTLVVMNRVDRAQDLYTELQKLDALASDPVLIHSRFRETERDDLEGAIERASDEQEHRIVVATQVIEAGVDLDSRLMVTELAPWPSIVQRVGRCNRAGEFDDAAVIVVDAESGGKAAAPYESEALDRAREELHDLEELSPAALEAREVDVEQPFYHVLRERDALELFDTTADVGGNDLDVKRYVRDVEESDVLVYWREWESPTGEPPEDTTTAGRSETCRVPCFGATGIRDFIDDSTSAWRWDPLEEQWREADDPLPGQTILLHSEDGGYDTEVGWTGKHHGAVPPRPTGDKTPDGISSDQFQAHDWVPLTEHLGRVEQKAVSLAEALDETLELDFPEIDTTELLADAAVWHDVGKAHCAFQQMLKAPLDTDDPPAAPKDLDVLYAKSNHRRGSPGRKYFRHELASALALLAESDGTREADLLAYLVASHHGKVRLSIRSLPQEEAPNGNEDRMVARGVWDGDTLPAVDVPGRSTDLKRDGATLDLEYMTLGEGSWLERTLALRDDPELGPFRLAYLEAMLRIADRRASREEKTADSETPEVSQ